MAANASRLLSLVLRHDPGRIGLALDRAGWVEVDALLAACAAHGVALTRAELEELVATSDKQRFALSPDGARIRANQGHSLAVELDLTPATPPARLYHGTVERVLDGIRAHGLVRGVRHHVHLSADVETAKKVGARRGRPVVLVVQAAEMAAAGHVFFRSENGVWLVDHVPFEFLELPAPRGAGCGRRGAKVAIAKQTLAACEAGHYVDARGQRVELAEALARAHPGGGFLGGAQAQEETLARSSGLYPCLLAQPAYYERNRAHCSALYLDLVLFSPHVPFFRDDHGGWFEQPVLASVITAPAPNASALRRQGRLDDALVAETLARRAARVLAVAAHHAVDRLVLGAWGAGVFGNDPHVVAHAFRDLLAGRFAGAFAEVVFAVLGDRDTSPNHRAFAEVLGTRAG